MQFGIIFLPSPSHAGSVSELIKQSKLKSNALFATFASEATGTVKDGFDDTLVFQESSGQALKMLDIVLRNPVSRDLLLKELQTILERVINREGMGFRSFFGSQRRLRKDADVPRPIGGVRKD